MGLHPAATPQNGTAEPAGRSSFQIDRYSEVKQKPAVAKHTGTCPRNLSYLSEAELVDPAQQVEYAVSSEKIYENYPFYGTLMKLKGTHYRKLKDIPKQNATCIEQVERKHGPGDYELRLATQDERQLKLSFTIEDSGSNSTVQQSSPDPIDAIALRSQQKTAETYEEIIRLLEERNRNMQAELDHKSSKNRELQEDLATLERATEREKRAIKEELESVIDRLKEEKWERDKEIFELRMDLKYSDADGGFDLKSMLTEAASNPDIQRLLAPLLAKLFGGDHQQQPQLKSAALDGAQHQQPQAQAITDSLEDDQNRQQINPQPSNSQQMQYLVNQFSTGLVQTVTSAMLHGQPGQGQLKTLVMNSIRDVERQGIQLEPGLWVRISKQLIDVALQHGVSPEKAARTIRPLLEQIGDAADKLKFIPAGAAAEFLIGSYNIQATEAQKKFLVQLLEVFKRQLKQPTA